MSIIIQRHINTCLETIHISVLHYYLHSQEAPMESKKNLGNFRNMKKKDISFEDLSNAFTFYSLLLNTDGLLKWLMENKLLVKDLKCSICDANYKLYKRSKVIDGVAWRCTKNSSHEKSIRIGSIFEKLKYTIQDVMVFIREMVLGSTLRKSCLSSGIYYGHTAVDYSNMIRYSKFFIILKQKMNNFLNFEKSVYLI